MFFEANLFINIHRCIYKYFNVFNNFREFIYYILYIDVYLNVFLILRDTQTPPNKTV